MSKDFNPIDVVGQEDKSILSEMQICLVDTPRGKKDGVAIVNVEKSILKHNLSITLDKVVTKDIVIPLHFSSRLINKLTTAYGNFYEGMEELIIQNGYTPIIVSIEDNYPEFSFEKDDSKGNDVVTQSNEQNNNKGEKNMNKFDFEVKNAAEVEPTPVKGATEEVTTVVEETPEVVTPVTEQETTTVEQQETTEVEQQETTEVEETTTNQEPVVEETTEVEETKEEENETASSSLDFAKKILEQGAVETKATEEKDSNNKESETQVEKGSDITDDSLFSDEELVEGFMPETAITDGYAWFKTYKGGFTQEQIEQWVAQKAVDHLRITFRYCPDEYYSEGVKKVNKKGFVVEVMFDDNICRRFRFENMMSTKDGEVQYFLSSKNIYNTNSKKFKNVIRPEYGRFVKQKEEVKFLRYFDHSISIDVMQVILLLADYGWKKMFNI